jgi:hypothetical protein
MSISDYDTAIASTDDVFQDIMNPRWAEFSTVPAGESPMEEPKTVEAELPAVSTRNIPKAACL